MYINFIYNIVYNMLSYMYINFIYNIVYNMLSYRCV